MTTASPLLKILYLSWLLRLESVDKDYALLTISSFKDDRDDHERRVNS